MTNFWLLLVLLVAGWSSSAELQLFWLTPSFETHHVFCGEFPCLDANVSGPHEFLRFELAIYNTGPEEVFISESDRFIDAELYDALTDMLIVSELGIPLPGLRDSVCLNGHAPVLVRGSDFRLSPNCYTRFAPTPVCFWIDVTNLTLPDALELRVTLSSLTSGSVEFQATEVDHNNHVRFTVGSVFVPVYFLSIFFAGFISHVLQKPKQTSVEPNKS